MNTTENLHRELLKAKLESIYKKVEDLANAVGKKELEEAIGEKGLRGAINATFFEGVLLESKRGDPVLKEDLTLTLIVAATMLKR